MLFYTELQRTTAYGYPKNCRLLLTSVKLTSCDHVSWANSLLVGKKLKIIMLIHTILVGINYF